jgi:hypothetical protein
VILGYRIINPLLVYRLADWDFRVLFRGLIDSMESSLRRISVAVQLSPEDLKQQEYLVDYFGNIKVEVYWGTGGTICIFSLKMRARTGRKEF